MTDKELKSLTKIQMLELLHQQEGELEKMKGTAGAPAVAPDSALLNEILQGAQRAADSYLQNIQSRENEKIDGIAKLENDARSRYEDAERYSRAVAAAARETIDEVNGMFAGLKELIETMHADFQNKLSAIGLRSGYGEGSGLRGQGSGDGGYGEGSGLRGQGSGDGGYGEGSGS